MDICRTEHKVSAHMARVLASLRLVSFTELPQRDCILLFRCTSCPCIFPLEEATEVRMYG